MLCAMSTLNGGSVEIPICEAHADSWRRGTAEHERAAIVAWLRRDSTTETEPAAWDYARRIEAGEHRKEEP